MNFYFLIRNNTDSLINIITENKLKRNNYKNWKLNINIVLSYDKHKSILDTRCTLATQVKVRTC